MSTCRFIWFPSCSGIPLLLNSFFFLEHASKTCHCVLEVKTPRRRKIQTIKGGGAKAKSKLGDTSRVAAEIYKYISKELNNKC
jgi:hypothetical protein